VVSARPGSRGAPVIIDCHCHAGKGDGLTGPWDTDAPLGRYLRRAARAGIDRTVLFAPFHSDYAVANRQVARIVAGDRRRFLGFAFVNPERDRGRVAAMIAEAVGRHGFCGIKAHRHDARMTREVCEVARAWRLPVLYDVMGEAADVDLLASEYPDVAFVVPHLGSFADDWRAQTAFLDQLARHPNVHTDTSGVRRFDLLAEAVRRAGAAKVLFGSDGPWLHPGLELAKVRALGLAPDQLRLVLGGNLLRLLARVRRPPSRRFLPVPGPRRPLPPPVDPWLARPLAGAGAPPHG
jgi:predicted TIM-barrel fold metal-dependent hydrolase